MIKTLGLNIQNGETHGVFHEKHSLNLTNENEVRKSHLSKMYYKHIYNNESSTKVLDKIYAHQFNLFAFHSRPLQRGFT